jgi:hypothetical protein
MFLSNDLDSTFGFSTIQGSRSDPRLCASSAGRRFLIMWRGFVGIIRRGLGVRRFVMSVRRGCDFRKIKVQELTLTFPK